jgi:hypothetical protein
LEDHLLTVFKVELKSQCEQASVAAGQLDSARNQTEVWAALQNILVTAANASKLLWGTRGREVADRPKPLRDRAGVTDDSPLKPRDVRNAFEHFDERIERWYDAGDTKVFASRNVGPPESIRVGTESSQSHFGNFDPATGIVTFWDWSVSIPDLLDELKRIYEALSPKPL